MTHPNAPAPATTTRHHPHAHAPTTAARTDTTPGAPARPSPRARRAAAGVTIALLPLVAAAIVLAAPPLTPMALARALHGARLRLHGATVDPYPATRLQQAANDCGVAVAHELARLRHQALPDAAARTALPLTPHGITLNALAAGLGALGLPGTVLRHAWDAPLHPHDVALLRTHHYVLVLAESATRVSYYDPMVGRVHLTRAAFQDAWTGKLIRPRHAASPITP